MRAIGVAVVLGGCTTLGPMPATTGVSPVPSPRHDATLQFGFMPGYYLSEATQPDPNGAVFPQLAATYDPGKVVPGLVVGGRLYGESGDTCAEPMIGYRRKLGAEQLVSLSGVLHGTRSSAAKDGASYEATRVGLELGADYQLTADRKSIEPHLIGFGGLNTVSASGEYCSFDGEHGSMCDEPVDPAEVVTAEASGVYPSIAAGLALDFGRHLDSPFHGVRLEGMLTIGGMPRVVDEQQGSMASYFSVGLALSASFGAK